MEKEEYSAPEVEEPLMVWHGTTHRSTGARKPGCGWYTQRRRVHSETEEEGAGQEWSGAIIGRSGHFKAAAGQGHQPFPHQPTKVFVLKLTKEFLI